MSDGNSLDLITLQDLYDNNVESCEWLVENMLPVGGLSLLVAKPKVGKTSLAETLIHCVATGIPALGRTTRQGEVIYLQLEASAMETKDHFRKLGTRGDAPIRLLIGGVRVPDPVVAVEQALYKHRPVLLVVDSIQQLLRFPEINEYSSVSNSIDPYVRMARHYGIHILFLHHLGKEEHPSAVSDGILGSTALFGFVDLALVMLKNGDVRTIQTDGPQRFGIDISPTILRRDPETGLITAGEDLAKSKVDKLHQAIWDALGDMTLRMEEIKKAVGGDTGAVHREVTRMFRDGLLERVGTGKSGDPYMYGAREHPIDTIFDDQDPLTYAEQVRREAEEWMAEVNSFEIFKEMPN